MYFLIMILSSCVDALCLLSPLELAADWDNVGLLLEAGGDVRRIMLTLDVTRDVVTEAVDAKVDLLVAYHPPIFTGMKRLVTCDSMGSSLLRLLDANISVFSPHTALDAAPGGVSDWLALGLPDSVVTPLEGSGRFLAFTAPTTVDALMDRFSIFLDLPYIRYAQAAGSNKSIRTMALCPGAGASVLREVEADLVFTGEMRHHDVLSLSQRGVHVLLSEHSHTERPYLPVYRKRLLDLFPPEVEILVSSADRDPIHLSASRA